jgi:hypothetical protein
MFVENVGWLSGDLTALCPKRLNSSPIIVTELARSLHESQLATGWTAGESEFESR